jgi:hypothetical protein
VTLVPVLTLLKLVWLDTAKLGETLFGDFDIFLLRLLFYPDRPVIKNLEVVGVPLGGT